MARKPRIEFEGALYHIIARGNQRQDVFRSQEDFTKYLNLLSSYKDRYQFFLYAYVLMTNHVHLLIEIKRSPLSKILQGLQQSYTIYFNRKYSTVGHLFQGRYKAILCDKDEYLLTLVKYIHSNPLRAKVTKTIDDYSWSSHRAYLMKAQNTAFLDTAFILRMFSQNISIAIRQYQDFMSNGVLVDKEEIYNTVDQRLLGDEKFIEEIKDKVDSEISGKRRIRLYTLDKITGIIETVAKVSLNEMRSNNKSRNVVLGRKLFSRVAKEFSYQNLEIAKFLKKDPSAVTHYFGDLEGIEYLEDLVITSLSNVKYQV